MRDRRADDRDPPPRRGPPLRSDREERRFILVFCKAYIHYRAFKLLLTVLGCDKMGISFIFSHLNYLGVNQVIERNFSVIENFPLNLTFF